MTREASDAFVDRIERTGTSTAGACGRSRCRASPRSSATSACGRRTTSPTGWSRSAGAWRAHWGNGYATEAAREALRFGFEEVGLDEIVSFTVPQNVRSRRVMERIGLMRDAAGDFDHPRVDPVRVSAPRRARVLPASRDEWQRDRA